MKHLPPFFLFIFFFACGGPQKEHYRGFDIQVSEACFGTEMPYIKDGIDMFLMGVDLPRYHLKIFVESKHGSYYTICQSLEVPIENVEGCYDLFGQVFIVCDKWPGTELPSRTAHWLLHAWHEIEIVNHVEDPSTYYNLNKCHGDPLWDTMGVRCAGDILEFINLCNDFSCS